MNNNIFDKYFAWQIKRLIAKDNYGFRNFEAETNLNLTRIYKCENGFTRSTFEKVCLFFSIGPHDFWKDYEVFLETCKDEIKVQRGKQ